MKVDAWANADIVKPMFNYNSEFLRSAMDPLSVGILESGFVTIQTVMTFLCGQKPCHCPEDSLLTCAL